MPNKSQSLFSSPPQTEGARSRLSTAEQEFQQIRRRRIRLVLSVLIPVLVILVGLFFWASYANRQKRLADFAVQKRQDGEDMRSRSLEAFRKKVEEIRLEEARTNMRWAAPQMTIREFSAMGGIALPGFQLDQVNSSNEKK